MKKIVYSFWSAPLTDRWSSYPKLIDTNIVLEQSLNCLYLSVLYAKKWGFEIEIFTDLETKRFLKNLPVDNISTDLSFLTYSNTWIEGKLLAISKQSEPFIYMDWDVILNKKNVANILNSFKEDVLIQSFDELSNTMESELSLNNIKAFEHQLDFSPYYIEDFYKTSTHSANTSILGFNNLKTRDKYVTEFLKCLSITRNNKLKGLSKIIDKYLFNKVLNSTNANCKVLLNTSDINIKATEIGYTHLTFLSKYNSATQKKIIQKIKNEFPDYNFLIDKKGVQSKVKISLCTVVMNRFDHFVTTLKHNLKIIEDYNDIIDINIIDYNSTDGLEEYLFSQKWFLEALEKKQLFYYKNYTAKYYHRTLPKNIIHFLSEGDYLINIDADNFIDHDYLDFCIKTIKDNTNFFLRPSIKNTKGSFGRIMIHKEDFKKIGGYNLNIRNYGFEDSEITLRLKKEGKIQLTTPNHLVLKYINHSDKLRFAKEAQYILKNNKIINPKLSNHYNKYSDLTKKINFDEYFLEIYSFNSKRERSEVSLDFFKNEK